MAQEDGVRVWLVERTYSDDEQNLIVLTYATADGRRYLRKERALTSFSDHCETPVSVVADPDDLGTVHDPETVEWYADGAASVAAEHGPDGAL